MNRINLERVSSAPSLGIGLDLPWESSPGFKRGSTSDQIDVTLQSFLDRNAAGFGHFFFAFQPKDRNRLDLANYASAYEALLSKLKPVRNLAFHHTMLNVCGESTYDRRHLLNFTNNLIREFGIKWVNEDIGIWSLGGKALPYPLGPILTRRSLALAIDVVKEIQDVLICPFVLEFPGFTDGSSLVIGELDAFDYFAELAYATDSWVNLDTGHILSYKFLCARMGKEIPDLERLPLANCFEVHLAGSQLVDGLFRDMHDGRILQEQFDLLEYLLVKCPELGAVTFEDPRIIESGQFEKESEINWKKLRATISTFEHLALP